MHHQNNNGKHKCKNRRKNVFRPDNNGRHFTNFAMSRDIIISSTYFQRNNIYKQTWVSPDVRTKNRIDHVTIDKLHRSWFKKVRSYQGADSDTDHYLVVATPTEKLLVSWKKSKGRSKTNTMDLDRFNNPAEIRQYNTRIAEELKNIN